MEFPDLTTKPKSLPVWNKPHECPIPEQLDYRIMFTRLCDHVSSITETKSRLIDLVMRKRSTPDMLQKNTDIVRKIKLFLTFPDINEYSGHYYEIVCQINSELNSLAALVNKHWIKLNIYY